MLMQKLHSAVHFRARVRVGALAVSSLLTAGFADGLAFEPESPQDTEPAVTISKGSHDRLLFPHNWVRGYSEVQYAPSRNEPDLARCYSNTALYGGANAQCAAYARYMFNGYVELRPLGRTLLRYIFVFAQPTFFFGNNIPQVSYTQSMTPIAYENLVGAGIELPKNFELRVVNHGVHWLGRYRNFVSPADTQLGGPLGSYATVGVRWYFGGYARLNGAP